jgi:hypothetical protein
MYAFYVAVGSTSLLVSLLLTYQLWIERLMVRIVRSGPSLLQFSTRTLIFFSFFKLCRSDSRRLEAEY